MNITEQSVQDGDVAVNEKQDRSMARLAEILRERGYKVLWYKEQDCCRPSRLSFRGGGKVGVEVNALVVELGYPVISSSKTSYFQSTGKFRWSVPDFVMEFAITSS